MIGWGKVIVLGEHAVVYGHPALAGALDRGVSCTAHAAPGPDLRLRVPAWDVDVVAGEDHPVAIAIAAIAAALGVPGLAARLDGEAALPPAAGLGSSAALAVAVTRALAAHLGRDLDDDQVAAIAGTAEACFHGRPSGVDVALATRGGLGVFRRGAGFAPLLAPPLSLVIGLSGEPRSTAAMVDRVAAATGADPADRRLVALGAAAEAGARLLVAADLGALGPLLTAAHHTLAELGVSTPRVDAMVADALAAGALGAKLTGAGGGGAVLALAPGREAEVVAAWHRAGHAAFTCVLGKG